MIPVRRRGLLLDLLRRQGTASVRELAQASEASVATVRRDLEQLELEGYLRRTRGGAMLAPARPSAFEPEAAVAAQVARAEKRAIGEAAARLLENGDSVIFDSGSTVHMAAQAVVRRSLALTAVTNDLGIAQTLSQPPDIRVVVLGGTLRKGSLTLIGEPGVSMLRDMHVDVAYVGTQSIGEQALSDASIEIATIKRAIIAAARRVILLADGSKFESASFFRFSDVTAVHEVITDASAPAVALQALRKLGLGVTVVEP
ncbi:MAG: DeoR/GlpR family DNA-binding transcription regulator [Burkholderiaceae bacterium]